MVFFDSAKQKISKDKLISCSCGYGDHKNEHLELGIDTLAKETFVVSFIADKKKGY